MSTLLLRLAGPLQAWGCESKFEKRRTGREPTKSAVVGLLAAALGRRRNEPVEDLCSLNFGVRVEEEGQLLRDFHIARTEGDKKTYVTERYYLSDACFLVGLETGDEVLLDRIEKALVKPAFPLFLGRRSCVPTLPILIGRRQCCLLEALQREPWLASEYMQGKARGQVRLRLITDAGLDSTGAAVQRDLPLSFDPGNRRYGYRPLLEHPPVEPEVPRERETEHDAMSEL